ncbi:hypothetical protein OQA88_8757 [Cercophora sp. LCS_1]
MAPEQQKFRFVNIENPTKVTRQVRRQVRSHVARETYGRARRARMAEHQKESENADKHSKEAEAKTTAEDPVQDTIVTNPVTLLSANRTDPFDAFATSLKRIEHLLLDHFVKVVIPERTKVCAGLKTPWDVTYYRGHMTTKWVPFALGDSSLLPAIFLAACRDLSLAYVYEPLKQMFRDLATKYKVACIAALTAVLGEGVSALDDSAVAKAIALTNDELALGDRKLAKNHLLGALKIVNLKGGPKSLGMDGLLEFTLIRLRRDKGIL